MSIAEDIETARGERDRGGPAQPLLLVDGLRKHFPVHQGLLGRSRRVVRAVDNLSFSVAKGETLGVVGESGCGKSTAARLLVRLIQPDAGTMVLDGDPIDEPHGITINELRRQVQMVFQDSYASLNPRLTIAETVAFAPRAHGLPAAEARERARDLMQKVGLEPARALER
jgi:peptide/nickel transport system ATP-binding protein